MIGNCSLIPRLYFSSGGGGGGGAGSETKVTVVMYNQLLFSCSADYCI